MKKIVDQSRVRREEGKNYLAVYENRQVMRFYDDAIGTGQIEATTIPEFMDIKLTDQCNGGCDYCYQDSGACGIHADDPIGRLETYFTGVPRGEGDNFGGSQMPFQVALGGGDPLLHPQFDEICNWFAANGVVPNLTTNGLNFTNENLKVIAEVCGGCAITAHRHLDNEWRTGFDRLVASGCEAPALHVLFSDQDSIDYIADIISDYTDFAYAIVMLPFINQGRARDAHVSVDWAAMDRLIESLSADQIEKLAWGALAYDYIRNQPILKGKLSLYEPEQFSRYLDLTTMIEYGSSFDVDAA